MAGGIVTLLFTDVVGSTELFARVGDDDADELRVRHFAVIRDAVDRSGGQVVKTLGDGVMAVFGSARGALDAAVEIQRRNAALEMASEDRRLVVRVGVHAGEAGREGDDYFGTPVVVAKRLCDAAAGGEIRVSSLVRGLVGSRGGHRFRDLGELELKGLAEPVAAASLLWEAERPSARIGLCGGLMIDLGGRRVDEALRSDKTRLLFVYLALNRRRRVGRDELVEALWADRPPDNPAGALRTVLSRLRRALGEDWVEGRAHIALRLPPEAEIDLERIEAAVREAEAALGQDDPRRAIEAAGAAAAGAAAGGLVPDLDAAWLDDRRRDLDELRVRALSAQVRAALDLGDGHLDDAVDAARAIVRQEPFRESGHALLMQAYAARGDVAEALRAYDALRTTLRDEMGTAPGPAVRALAEQLLANETPRAQAVANIDGDAAPAVGRPPLPPVLTRHGAVPFVGRAQTMDALERIWATAPEARAALALVEGDPGVGKTRLAAELAQRLHDAGAAVLYGRCDEDTVVPYQPFVEALRHCVVHCSDAVLAAVDSRGAAELARLVPELHHRRDLANLPRGEPDDSRHVLFEAVASIVRALAGEAGGTLLVVDDLHWADAPTLLMLRHVARALANSGTLVVATTRGIERTEAVDAAVAALRRDDLVEDVPLGGVSSEDVGAIVSALIGADADHATVRRLHAQTEGNPLFVGEIVRHVAQASEDPLTGDLSLERLGIPREIRAVIARRLRGLTDAARRALRVAAVIGPRFEVDLLESVTGDPREYLVDALEEAVHANVAVESGLGSFGFAHALIRSTLIDEMTRTRRAALHQRVAEAIERVHADDLEPHLSVLAFHYLESGAGIDTGKAVRYAFGAAERAVEMLAHEDAIELCTRALELLDRSQAPASVERCRLLLVLGRARHGAGDTEAAKQTFERAAAIAQRLGLHDELAQAAIDFGGRTEEDFGQEDERKIALLESALEAVADRAPALRARLLARLATAKLVSEGPERVRQLSDASVAAARQSGEDLPRAEALIARTWALWTPEHTERRLGMADELVRLAERLGDPVLRLQSRIWRVVALGELSQLEEVEKEIPRPDARGGEWIVNKYYDLAWRNTLALLRGQLDDAERILSAIGRLVAETPLGGNLDHALGIKTFAVLRERRELTTLREPLADLVSRYPGLAGWRAALALAHAESGFEDDARREFELIGAGGWEALPRDGNWLATLSVLAPTCALLGCSKHAEALYGLLQPYAHRAVVVSHFLNWSGPVSHYLGELALCSGRVDQSVDHFEDALQRSRGAGSRLYAIRAQRGLAMALLARDGTGDTARARALVKDGLQTARDCGLIALDARLRDLVAQLDSVGADA